MIDEVQIAVGFAAAALVTGALTPHAIRAARRTGFLDRPYGYKGHKEPTPYLGGTAVLAGFVVGALLAGGVAGRFVALLMCTAGLCLMGLVDDRMNISPRVRVLAGVVVAWAMFEAGVGWSLFSSDAANLALTVVWVVGIVNAFNLMDNLDGATGTVAGVCAAGIGAFALAHGDGELAAMALALCGACLGFLPYNLAAPAARIFLGDGGSLPIGLLVAGLAMEAADRDALGVAGLLAGALLVGLVILDTTLVSISRRRRGLSLLQGGRDHVTHRLLARLGTTRRVAATLAVLQAVLCGAAILGDQLGRDGTAWLAGVAVLLGVMAIAVLESPAWAPPYEEPLDFLPPGTATVPQPSPNQRLARLAVAGGEPEDPDRSHDLLPQPRRSLDDVRSRTDPKPGIQSGHGHM